VENRMTRIASENEEGKRWKKSLSNKKNECDKEELIG
jgi:hypothetical protein